MRVQESCLLKNSKEERMRIESGGDLRTWGQWKQLGYVIAMEEATEAAKAYKVKPLDGNVVGGSLDGARMPEGTRDGQTYRWDGKNWNYVQ